MRCGLPFSSEVQRFAHWLPATQMRGILDDLLRRAVERPKQLGLKKALDL